MPTGTEDCNHVRHGRTRTAREGIDCSRTDSRPRCELRYSPVTAGAWRLGRRLPKEFFVKRWVAYQRSGHAARPLFLIEAETEKEALCLASDATLRATADGGAWGGPLVHVRLAEEAPAA